MKKNLLKILMLTTAGASPLAQAQRVEVSLREADPVANQIFAEVDTNSLQKLSPEEMRETKGARTVVETKVSVDAQSQLSGQEGLQAVEMANNTTRTALIVGAGIALTAAGTTAYVANTKVRIAEENTKAKHWEAEAAYWNSEAKKWQALGDNNKANEALALAKMRNDGAQVIQNMEKGHAAEALKGSIQFGLDNSSSNWQLRNLEANDN